MPKTFRTLMQLLAIGLCQACIAQDRGPDAMAATPAAPVLAQAPTPAPAPSTPPSPAAAPAGGASGGAAAPAGPNKLMAVLAGTEKGKLKNPFTDNADMIAEGRKLYLSYSCNGCHGGGGGGGMCPPLTNAVWVYGSDDDTLFRLVTLGSDALMKEGYGRKGREGVVGPMPAYRDILKTEDELWKIIAFVRSVYSGEASRRNW